MTKVNSHGFKSATSTSRWFKSNKIVSGFTQNLDPAGNARRFFVLGEIKWNISDFWQVTVKYGYFKTTLPAISVVNSCYKDLYFRYAGIPWLTSYIPVTTNNALSDWNMQIQVGTNKKYAKKISSVI